MKNVVIPKMGMGTTEIEIFKWLVQEGDEIKKGDPIVEIESEKTNVTIESEYYGRINQIFTKEGDAVPVGGVICTIEEES